MNERGASGAEGMSGGHGASGERGVPGRQRGAHLASERVLRRVLEAEAQAVEVSPDALASIRTRIAERRRAPWLRRRVTFGVGTGAVLATAATVIALVLGSASCVPTHERHTPIGGTPSTAPAAPTPAPAPTAAVVPPPETSATPDTTDPVSLAVYYTGQRNLLYREFHKMRIVRAPSGVSRVTGRIDAALAEMLRAGSAYDPDYRSLWQPSTELHGVSVDGRVVTLRLSGVAVAPRDAAGRRAALEELVWTATQITGVDRVRLVLSGPDAAALNALVPAGGLLARSAQLDVLAPVWVIDPQQGATTGRTVTLRVDGCTFEAVAVVRVRNASGAVVLQRSLHVGSVAVPSRATVSVTVPLAPGRYTVQGFVFSAKDGSVQDLDDHTFTVR